MLVYNPSSPWLPTAFELAEYLSVSTVTLVPSSVRDQSSLTSVLRYCTMAADALVPSSSRYSHTQMDGQGRGFSVRFASVSNVISHKEDGTAKPADGGLPIASQKMTTFSTRRWGAMYMDKLRCLAVLTKDLSGEIFWLRFMSAVTDVSLTLTDCAPRLSFRF